MEYGFTIHSKVGRFDFEKGTSKGKAKRIRDTIMGHILAPEQYAPKVKILDHGNAKAFVLDHCDLALQEVHFKFTPAS